MNILVSACLQGLDCRYDGKHNLCEKLLILKKEHTLIPFCPEIYGGLPTPREPAEIKNGNVFSKSGKDVTPNFSKGAEEALKIAHDFDCKIAILKERSPSCGSKEIYDGSFSKKLTSGDGITASLLKKNGISVYGESEIEKLIAEL